MGGEIIGLSTAEALRRLEDVGPNRASEEHEETFLEELFESFREPLVLLLLLVCGLYILFGETRDALIVFGVIVAVALAETSIEWRAGRATAAQRPTHHWKCHHRHRPTPGVEENGRNLSHPQGIRPSR